MSIIQAVKEISKNQAFTKHIGAELDISEDGIVKMTLDIAPHHMQQYNFVHGGVISYLADNSLTFAGGIALNGNAVTSEYKINYLRPAIGKRLLCRAKAISAGSNQSVCSCEIFVITDDGKEKLCAVATGTIVRAKI